MRKRRIFAAAAAVAAGTLALNGVAMADQIVNNVDVSVDAVAETMALNVGGGAKTTQLRVITTDGDGKNGCNFQAHDAITVAVNSSDTGVATVSPSSLTFGSCGDVLTVTVTPVGQGESSITLSETVNTTGYTFDYLPARFTAAVAPAAPSNKAPNISVDGVDLGGSYSKGAVPPATCRVTDAEDGSRTFAATLSAITGPYASDGIGSQTASCEYTDAGGIKAAASKTYSIIDPSAPEIGYTLTPAAPDGENGWYVGAVTLVWDVTDGDSPNSLVKDGCADQSVTQDQAEATYSCSASSAGGAAGPVTVNIKRDATAPVVSTTAPVVAGDEGTNGWYTSPVTVAFTAEDALSGPASETKQVTSSGEGDAVQVQSPAFTDLAGNTTAPGSVTKQFKIDKTAPNAPTVSLNPEPNPAGWNQSNVVVSFASAGDPGTGASGVGSCTADVPVSTETAGETVRGTCTDVAGNRSSATSVVVRLDKTAPTGIAFVDGPADNGKYYPNNVPAASSTCTATDTLSDLESCVVTGYSTAVGTHTLTATATDNAGNVSTATRTYTVRNLTLSGFFAPVDMGGVLNTVKAGSTVPLKFRVFDEGVEQKDTGIVKAVAFKSISCTAGAAEDAIEQVATTGGTALRYDTTGGQFIQNWQTPKSAGSCYSVTMKTVDDSTISALFKLK